MAFHGHDMISIHTLMLFDESICKPLKFIFKLCLAQAHCTKNEVFHEGFIQQMWPNPQEPADLVTFTEEIFNGKLNFCAVVIFSFKWKRAKTIRNNMSKTGGVVTSSSKVPHLWHYVSFLFAKRPHILKSIFLTYSSFCVTQNSMLLRIKPIVEYGDSY